MIDFQTNMKRQLDIKHLFEQAKGMAFDYIDRLPNMDVFPSEVAQYEMHVFEEQILGQ